MLEICTSEDRFFDYCLWEYTPVTNPHQKLRSINLLHASLDQAQLGEHAKPVIQAIRAALGDAKTVWGVKYAHGHMAWEFYFYDYDRQARGRSVTRLLDIVRPWLQSDVQVNEACDYFMFSIDLDAQALQEKQRIDEVQIYMGNVGSSVSSGICYSVTRSALTMKNFYFFFDFKTQFRDIVDKLTSSVYLDLSKFEIGSVLWPELCPCKTIVLANKRTHDGIYFSRITVDQLIFFLRRLSYPSSTIDFLTQHRQQLDHMLYDVGFDYRMQEGKLQILKSAYYGVF